MVCDRCKAYNFVELTSCAMCGSELPKPSLSRAELDEEIVTAVLEAFRCFPLGFVRLVFVSLADSRRKRGDASRARQYVELGRMTLWLPAAILASLLILTALAVFGPNPPMRP